MSKSKETILVEFEKKFATAPKDAEVKTIFLAQLNKEEMLPFLSSALDDYKEQIVESVIEIIKNGGTPVTVNIRTVDGQKYVNEQQLIESLATLK